MKFINIFIKILTIVLLQIKFSSSQVIPEINISQNTNTTASIAVNTSQESDIKLNNDLVNQAIHDTAQNKNLSSGSSSAVASESELPPRSPKISKLPVEILHETELDKINGFADEQEIGETEEFGTEDEARADIKNEIKTDDILQPEIESNVKVEKTPVTPEDED